MRLIWTTILAFFLSNGVLAQDSAKNQLYSLFEAKAELQKQERGDTPFPASTEGDFIQQAADRQQLLQQLQAIDRDALSEADQVNYDIFAFILSDEIAAVTFKSYLIPFNAEGGFYNRLRARGSFRNSDDFDRYHKSLRAFPAFLNDNIQLLEQGIKEGIIAPRVIAKNYEVLIAPYRSSDPVINPLFGPYVKERPASISASDWKAIRSQGEDLIRQQVLPAYAKLHSFMQETYLPKSRTTVGISEIPNGKAYYEQRIRHFTTLNMTPEEVFQTGQKEVARIRSEMEQIIRDVDFEGSFADFLTFLRTDPQFYAKTPRDLLKEASYFAKKIDGKMPLYFEKLPRLTYGVEPVPAAIAPNYTGGRYSPGSIRRHRAGQYWVNTYKLGSRPLYVLPALTLHEAVPGHHLQMALAEEQESGPEFRRSYYISAFGEGWALYTEFLGVEMGIYETPYEHFGRMTYEMWRACRLVVDVGMHYKGWTRQEALDFLSSNTALSMHECNTEIDRYIGWPGQAVSYKIGELTIRRLRQEAEETLGDKFDLRAFHQRILETGSVPLFVLEDKLKRMINDQQQTEGSK